MTMVAVLACFASSAHGFEAFTNAPAAKAVTGPVGVLALGVGRYCQVGAYNDGADWAYVAGKADSYITGNCHDGWAVNHQASTVTNLGISWRGGYFGGGYASCGWTKTMWLTNLLGGAGDDSCSNPNKEVWEYASQINSSYPTDGTFVGNQWECPLYANVKPWSINEGPNDFIRMIPQHARHPNTPGSAWRIRWRYVTRYRGYVMVRDRAAAEGTGNWGFVPRTCLPTTLPP